MYINNGYVYGGMPKEIPGIAEARALDDGIMILTFKNGETRLFDSTVLTGPVFAPLKDESVFKNFAIDHGVVTWLDGEIDCAPEYMYKHSYEYAAAS